jgi:hypothetical protein
MSTSRIWTGCQEQQGKGKHEIPPDALLDHRATSWLNLGQQQAVVSTNKRNVKIKCFEQQIKQQSIQHSSSMTLISHSIQW